MTDEGNETHPYRLITPRAKSLLNTSFSETDSARDRECRPRLLIHEQDAAAEGIAQGDPVRLANRLGEISLPAEPTRGIARGVLAVEGIWPGSAFEEGIGSNALVSADSVKPSAGAEFHDTAIWLSKIS